MCFTIYLSTTSGEDLSLLPSKLYQFIPLTMEYSADIIKRLDYPNPWFLVGQYGSCSCQFRHLIELNDMWFGPPKDWCPEDPEDIEATKAVYQIFAKLVADGHSIDLIGLWSGREQAPLTNMTVSLSEIGEDSFRFFENYKFNLHI